MAVPNRNIFSVGKIAFVFSFLLILHIAYSLFFFWQNVDDFEDSQTSLYAIKYTIENQHIQDAKEQDNNNIENTHITLPNKLPQLRSKFEKPVVAIIIDDIISMKQVKRIKALDIKVTPSIMPNSTANPHSNKLRELFSFYMVHLPLEAENFFQKEHVVLHVGDSEESICKRIETIKQEFPEVMFLNNHTGSKFSADFDSMEKLLRCLKDSGIVFIDSKTTAKSVAKKVYNTLGEELLSRDVFLDYERNRSIIKKQLDATISLAKKKGYAVAIGHPYAETFEILNDKTLLDRGVEFVYVYELYEVF